MATIGHFEKLRALCGSARLLVTGGTRAGAASQVVIFDHVANKVRHSLDVPTHVLGLCLHGELLLVAGADGTLRVYETEGGKALHQVAAHSGACVAVVAGGPEQVYTAGTDGRVRRWDVHGKALGEWSVSAQALRAVAIDPTGEYVAAAGDAGVVHVLTPGSRAPQRDMPGHDGPVQALAFTPRDGRLVSGGDDGTLRIWYLVGAIESETRTTEGQAAAVRALVFPPTPAAGESGGEEPLDRFFAAGADGKVRVFRLEDRRKPRTLDCGSRPVQALCFLPPTTSAAKSALGAVALGGDSRTVYRYPLELDGTPGDKVVTYDHGFDALTAAVGLAKPAREAAYKTLAALDEPEALTLLLGQLAAEKEPELRVLIAEQLGSHRRLAARAGLRQALDDGHAGVRQAALRALRLLEGELALAPLRAALRGRHADIRQAALRGLLGLRDSSPLAAGLITSALTDADGGVRLVALEAVLGLYPPGTAEPLRLAFERGPADIRGEALVRAGFTGLLTAPELAPLLARALDDEDEEVRRIAFALAVLLQPPLAALLELRDEDFARTTREILRREALRRRAAQGAPVAEGKQAAKEPTPSSAPPAPSSWPSWVSQKG
jgi:ParB family chromosome partitioning protein